MDIIGELTDGTSLLRPSTLVHLLSSLTSGYPLVSISQSPPCGLLPVLTSMTVPRLVQALGPPSPPLLKIPTPVSFHSGTLSPPQKGVSNLVPLPSLEGYAPNEQWSLSQKQQRRDISEALEREVTDGTCAKPRRPKEALQKDSSWRKEQIS